LIWAKNHFVMGRSDYQWAHEPCFYAAKDGQTPAFYAGRNEVSIWRVASGPAHAQSITLGHGLVLEDDQGRELYLAPHPPKGKKLRRLTVPAEGTLSLEADDATSTVWEVAKDIGILHPTQKPVELARRALANSSLPGDAVLDSFCGAGGTLLACQQTGRIGYGLELDLGYAAVILCLFRTSANSGGPGHNLV
jgi:DNA modification methylase